MAATRAARPTQAARPTHVDGADGAAQRTGRSRRDLCPGVLRPWPAEDGALVRVRLVGGRVAAADLRALCAVAREHGDGDLHLTSRANLQLRGLPIADGRLPEGVVRAIGATGLLPSRTHDLARNLMVSPLTGVAGGRADLRSCAGELDRRLRAEPALAALPGRFLFVLDDGRGDLIDRTADLGLVALDDRTCQLRHGEAWGEVATLDSAPAALVALAGRFVGLRGTGEDAAWHVRELSGPLAPPRERDRRTRVTAAPLAHGPGTAPDGATWDHVAAPDGVLGPGLVSDLTARAPELVVTPWRGVVVPPVTTTPAPATTEEDA